MPIIEKVKRHVWPLAHAIIFGIYEKLYHISSIFKLRATNLSFSNYCFFQCLIVLSAIILDFGCYNKKGPFTIVSAFYMVKNLKQTIPNCIDFKKLKLYCFHGAMYIIRHCFLLLIDISSFLLKFAINLMANSMQGKGKGERGGGKGKGKREKGKVKGIRGRENQYAYVWILNVWSVEFWLN